MLGAAPWCKLAMMAGTYQIGRASLWRVFKRAGEPSCRYREELPRRRPESTGSMPTRCSMAASASDPAPKQGAEHFGELTDHKVRSHGQNGSCGPSAPE